VSTRVPILDFPEALLDAVRNGRLGFTKAQALARLEDERARDALLAEAIEGDLSLSQIRRRITELRQGAEGAKRPERDERFALASTTRRLLNRQRLERLGGKDLARVTALLRELKDLLES
jgi:ParB family chromosome partitioning protein